MRQVRGSYSNRRVDGEQANKRCLQLQGEVLSQAVRRTNRTNLDRKMIYYTILLEENNVAHCRKKKKPTSYCTQWCNRILNSIRALYSNSCVLCKGKDELEFAHLERTGLSFSDGRGKFKRTSDILRNPGKYTLLCRECHHDFDVDMQARKTMLPHVKSVEQLSAKSPEVLARLAFYQQKELPAIAAQ